MRYFHCPKTYKRKPYGCGFGPVNATVAYLDLGDGFTMGKCPKCKHPLRPYKPTRIPAVPGPCQVTSVPLGTRYCNEPTARGRYCTRHAYLAPTGLEAT